MRRLLLTLLTATISSFCLLAPASAANAADWQAGDIIDDSVFYNKDAMSVGEIQHFLNSKVPNCDTSGSQTSELGGGTRAQYGSAHNNPPPFVCLKDYYENISNGQN